MCGSVTLRNAIIKHTTTGTLIHRARILLMVYCSKVETSEEPTIEEPTAHLQHLDTLRKRMQRRGATEEAKTEEKLRGREQKQRDLDESEQEARASHVC